MSRWKSIPALLTKPEYIFQPAQILKRFASKSTEETTVVSLPWGISMRIFPGDAIGSAILNSGVYDMALCEAIFRLVDAGDTVADIGANIGYTAGCMATAAGPEGKVLAFEPMPELYQIASTNIENWSHERTAKVVLENIALSSSSGKMAIFVPEEFARNRGIATMQKPSSGSTTSLMVDVARLEDKIPAHGLGLMKIDVEGHELDVFKGAESLLREHRIRDIIFEDHGLYPSPVSAYLESFGYTIFTLRKGIFKPHLQDKRARGTSVYWETPNYIATTDPKRCRQRFNSMGWLCLKSRGG